MDMIQEYLESINETDDRHNSPSMSISIKQASGLMGGSAFKNLVTKLGASIKKEGKKLSDKKITYHVESINLMFVNPGISINVQGKFDGGGAINQSAFVSIKTGNIKLRPIETVGRI